MTGKEKAAMTAGACVRGLSWLLCFAGGMAFLYGDKALMEFAHWNFAAAEAVGIGGGLALAAAGFCLRAYGGG